MAVRPVFVPTSRGHLLVNEIDVHFKWHPGMAPSQKKKNIVALHAAAKERGLGTLLEISSKSEEEVGRRLSAFNLKLEIAGEMIALECVYHGSKVFRDGGPFTDLFHLAPRDAKRDPRLRECGDLVHFELEGRRYPLSPKNAFYDWLYIRALTPHCAWIASNVSYDGFTDIEFNPKKSINCQARAFAELRAILERGDLEHVRHDFSYFASLLSPI